MDGCLGSRRRQAEPHPCCFSEEDPQESPAQCWDQLPALLPHQKVVARDSARAGLMWAFTWAFRHTLESICKWTWFPLSSPSASSTTLVLTWKSSEEAWLFLKYAHTLYVGGPVQASLFLHLLSQAAEPSQPARSSSWPQGTKGPLLLSVDFWSLKPPCKAGRGATEGSLLWVSAGTQPLPGINEPFRSLGYCWFENKAGEAALLLGGMKC